MPQDNPTPYIQQFKHQFDELTHKLRQDLQQIDEPQARALMETSAEVLQGLYKAFDDYEGKTEPAWKSSETRVESKEGEVKGNVGPSKPSSPTHG
jgi:hypothetical protein